MNFATVVTRHAHARPDAIAVVHEGRHRSYRDLHAVASRLAHGMRAAGVRDGDRVAVLLPNSLEFIEVYVAVMRLGAIFVPINVRLAADEIAYQLADCQATAIVTHPTFHRTVAVATDATSTWKLTTAETDLPACYTPLAELLDVAVEEFLDAPKDLGDVQRIVYTSGTTSRPKGTLLTHGQVWWGCATRCADFQFSERDVNLAVAPLYHVGGLDSFTTPMLYIGGTSVVLSRFDPSAVLDSIQAENVTNTWLAPTLLRQVLDVDGAAGCDASTLRVILGGGEKAPLPVIRRLHDTWPHAGYYDAYGLTECQGIATFLHARDSIRKIGSVGRPALLREVTVVGDDSSPVPPGQVGEICVRGPVITPGYWRAADATEKALVDGWLHTGDVGYLDEEGYLYVVDRLKDMIRSGLENVASSEIERVLYELPAVAEAAVVAMPDDRWGEVPAAYIVCRSGHDLSARDVTDHCRRLLAPFKVPKVVLFVDQLPRTASGKIQKHRLRESVRRRGNALPDGQATG